MQSISFAVFTYNSSDLITRILEHIKKAVNNCSVDYEVLLIDNNSSDNTINLSESFSKDENFPLKIIINTKQGLAYSRIEAVKSTSKEWITFVDDDNFINIHWIEQLRRIIFKYNPDVIGCKTEGITTGEFPEWWDKYKGNYACGSMYKNSGFIINPLGAFWGAGLTAKVKYLKPALLKMPFVLTGRIGDKQMAGEDTELCYRMRLMGAKFYYSDDLTIEHFIRSKRLTTNKLNEILNGFGYATVYKEPYEYCLTKKFNYLLWYKILRSAIAAVLKYVFYKTNNFPYLFLRIKTISERKKMIKDIDLCFVTSISMSKYIER